MQQTIKKRGRWIAAFLIVMLAWTYWINSSSLYFGSGRNGTPCFELNIRLSPEVCLLPLDLHYILIMIIDIYK